MSYSDGGSLRTTLSTGLVFHSKANLSDKSSDLLTKEYLTKKVLMLWKTLILVSQHSLYRCQKYSLAETAYRFNLYKIIYNTLWILSKNPGRSVSLDRLCAFGRSHCTHLSVFPPLHALLLLQSPCKALPHQLHPCTEISPKDTHAIPLRYA